MPATAGAQSLLGTPQIPTTPTTTTVPVATTAKAPSTGLSTVEEFGIFAFGIGAIPDDRRDHPHRRPPSRAGDRGVSVERHRRTFTREKKRRRAKGREAKQHEENRPKR